VPILFAPLVGFVLGVVLAWVAREDFARDEGPVVATRPVAIVTAFAFLVYAPIVGYFVTFHGDWAYLYVWAWGRIPSAVDLALVLLAAASIPAGLLASSYAARTKKLGVLVWFGGVPTVLAAGLFAWSARRLSVSATYAQFHGDFGTEPLASSALGRGVLWMAIVGALGIAWTIRSLDRGGDPRRR
jgi:hypothetical protein